MFKISALMLSASEMELFSWIHLLKKTLQKSKILIYPVWKNILSFKVLQIEVLCSNNYINFLLSEEAGASGNNIEKELQKPCPKLKIYTYIVTDIHIYSHTKIICSACNSV